ncbi:pseudouridine synthase [Mycena amicta]|nr:pseudouridine synthase [Mycena amicta]
MLSFLKWSELILYVDRAVIILNKPPGLITQHAPGNDFSRFLKDLQHRLQLPNTPFRVHRLDKARFSFSFVQLLRSGASANDLSTQLKQRTVEKTYLALVRGGRQSFGDQTSGEIRAPLHYQDGRASIAKGPQHEYKESVTRWELVASSPHLPLSLLRLNLLTGHKHQLRAHLAGVLKAPILGDALHSQKPPTDEIRHALLRLRPQPEDDRIFLHASQLSFFRYRRSGPDRRFRLRIVAPIPNDFDQLCKEARIPLGDLEKKGGLFMRSKEDHEYEEVSNGRIGIQDGCWMPDDSWVPHSRHI